MAPRVVANEFGISIYVNPDVIAQGLAAFDPASVGMQTGRIMHERLEELRAQRTSFAVESTLSGRSLQRVVRGVGDAVIHILDDSAWAEIQRQVRAHPGDRS